MGRARARPPRRPLVSWVTLLAGVALISGIGVVPLRGQDPQAAPREEAETAEDALRGEQVYARSCAVCHGADGLGVDAEGVQAGPPLVGLEVAYVDLLLRSGRMPITDPGLGVPYPDRLDPASREAVVAWMTERFDLVGEIPEVEDGDPARGHELYAIHCAACHASTGVGGVSGEGAFVRGVIGLDRVAIAEAIRVGPFEMPRFGEAVLTDEDVADIAAFTADHLSDPPQTPLGIAEMNRVTMWFMASVLGLLALGLVAWAGRPVRWREDDSTDDGGPA